MRRNRYKYISSLFTSQTTWREFQGTEKRIQIVVRSYKETFIPGGDRRIDESLIASRGRHIFKHYFLISGTSTVYSSEPMCNYCLEVFFIQEKHDIRENDTRGEAVGGFIVKKLVEDYTGKGHFII